MYSPMPGDLRHRGGDLLGTERDGRIVDRDAYDGALRVQPRSGFSGGAGLSVLKGRGFSWMTCIRNMAGW